MPIDFLGDNLILSYLFIFLARLFDMTLAILRVILVFRGRALLASTIGFFEIMIYMFALSQVFSSLDNPIRLVCFALGFATGNYLGAWIEGKMALGHVTVQLIPSQADHDAWGLDTRLREHGLAVTTLTGEGKNGPRPVLLISLRRRLLKEVMELIEKEAPQAFITVMDAKSAHGGMLGILKSK